MSASKPRLRSVRAIACARGCSSATIRRRCRSPPSRGSTAREGKGGESGPGRYRLSEHGEVGPLTLDVESRQTDSGVTVLAPSGRLDVVGAPALKEAVSEAMKKDGHPRLVIDMEGVTFVDSSGLGSVVSALKQVRTSKGDLRLAAPNQQVRVVLRLTPLDRGFPSFPPPVQPLPPS